VDFAIHYIESVRERYRKSNSFEDAFEEVSNGTAKAIWRNVLVISIGFLPLFFAGLVPYVTVGSFFFAIMLVSGVTTLVLLPSIVFVARRWLFKETKTKTKLAKP
jgi:predicted RND superfamily exporter protein